MHAHSPGNRFSGLSSGSRHQEHQPEDKQTRVIGNARLTALVSLVLLVLIIVELVTSAKLDIWLPAHTVVGVLLVGPFLVKMGSTAQSDPWSASEETGTGESWRAPPVTGT